MITVTEVSNEYILNYDNGEIIRIANKEDLRDYLDSVLPTDVVCEYTDLFNNRV